MSRQHVKASGKRRGQALAEFAIALTVLLLLVFGIVDLGRAVFAYNTIANCAREGTRRAVVCGADSPVDQKLGPTANDSKLVDFLYGTYTGRNYTSGLDPSRLTITSTWANTTNSPGSTVTVKVTYTFQPATLFFLQLPLQSQSIGTIVN